MNCPCGCGLTPLMERVLRELAACAVPDPMTSRTVHEIVLYLIPSVAMQGIGAALRALHRRGYAYRVFVDPIEWRISDRGALWCKEHPQ